MAAQLSDLSTTPNFLSIICNDRLKFTYVWHKLIILCQPHWDLSTSCGYLPSSNIIYYLYFMLKTSVTRTQLPDTLTRHSKSPSCQSYCSCSDLSSWDTHTAWFLVYTLLLLMLKDTHLLPLSCSSSDLCSLTLLSFRPKQDLPRNSSVNL